MGAWRDVRSLAVAMIAAGALLGVLPAAASAQNGGCEPGTPGLGDEYFPGYGNGGYDVQRYDLDIAYDPATDQLDGHALIRATSTQALCSFNLDLVGLDVDDVEVNGVDAEWTRTGQELTITPERPIRDGRRFRVDIEYAGVPQEFVIPGTDLRSGFMTTEDGATVIGQPEVAAFWFPVNDHPLDKATFSFVVTVPSEFEVVANGRLRARRRDDGTTTWRWRASEPMAPYLATIDIGHWDFDVWETESGIPVLDAVDSALTGELREAIDSSLSRQGEILDLLEEHFGPYPFNTVGGIVEGQDDLFFALETQTRPVYSKLFWVGPEGEVINGDDVVVHELAHQWFGDDIALARWQDIWLNEGFATYAEWMWSEYEGDDTPQEIFEQLYEDIPEDSEFWSVVIGDPGVDLLFDIAVYFRGAMTLQALRNEVGDDAFWTIVRRWASEQSGGHGTTDEFIALAEEVAGRDLGALFETWLFTGSRPVLPDMPPEPEDPVAAQALRGGAERWLDRARARLAHGRY